MFAHMPVLKMLRRTACALLAGAALMSTAAAAPAANRDCLTECKPRIGIVSAFGAEADILLEQTQKKRDWKINGNRFTTGELRGNPVVIVLSGVSVVNATMVTQLMMNHFHVERLLMSGIAGGINPANHVGDVIVAESWAMPMEVYWNGDGSLPSPCGAAGDVSCLGVKLATANGKPRPDFKFDTASGAVSSGLFMRDNFVMNASNAPQGEFRFEFQADPEMLALARTLKPALAKCGPKNPSLCVSVQPELRVGGRGVSVGAFMANPGYRAYLYDNLQAQVLDMETGAFAQVAYANRVPFIAFRSLSDLAGGNDFKDVGAFFCSGLAETNEASVTLAFLEAWSRRKQR
ncbi:5'-methylthioadenosine/S-adenosylhomocysteine nucleosidase family protein [Collimonas silvisoli]|uniref:5'-methylthioadenosine/S-adenosylhomocysteine nucleosidase family protein n=1 Tax=Collimonas silvisoli TaxID=2825884 RepID=UPI001E3DCF88|nr:5'-methylthioadenosine/S-adenosylhomocysteine nucleosidase [Collimonas silvisoli]